MNPMEKYVGGILCSIVCTTQHVHINGFEQQLVLTR